MIKLLNYFNLFVLIFISIFYYGCNKDEAIPEMRYLNNYAKSFGAFNYGSYWIFKNDSTSIEDSIYVSYFNDYFNSYGSDGEIMYRMEATTCKLISTAIVDSNMAFYLSAEYNNNEGSGKYFPQLLYSIKILDTSIIQLRGSLHYHPTYSINNSIYNSVYEYSDTLSLDSMVLNYNIYFVSNFGIVKRETFYKDGSTDSWSLLRSHIVW